MEENLRANFFNLTLLPAALYGSKTWSLAKGEGLKLPIMHIICMYKCTYLFRKNFIEIKVIVIHEQPQFYAMQCTTTEIQ